LSGECSLWGEDVSKSYGPTRVLEDASWVFRGNMTLLLAPNGAGKTTLLKLSLGLARPDRGRAGVCVDKSREMSFFIDVGEPPSWASVESYIRYSVKLRGLPYSRDEAIQTLREVGLPGNYLGKKIGGLSTGELKRVIIASLLVGDPEILVVDEPFSGLDPAGRLRISLLLNGLSRQRKVVATTHILSLLEGDEVYTIREGRVEGPLPPPPLPEKIHVYNLDTGRTEFVTPNALLEQEGFYVVLGGI